MSEVPFDQSSPTALKLATAKQKKETADQAFKLGHTKDALKAYHEALMYLLGLDKNALQSIGVTPKSENTDITANSKEKEKTEVDEIVEKIYANMSACHIKNGNWKRAQETADKAIAKNENNYKAIFRKGKALGEQGFFDKALVVLEDLKKKNPDETASVDQEIARLRIIDNDRERVHKQKMKGFFNKAVTKGLSTEESVGEVKSGFIEEVS